MAAMVVTRKREEMAVLVERELGLGDIVARLRVGKERFRARADPLHRAAGELGRQQHQRRLVEYRRLHAEAATGIAGDDAHFAVGHLEHLGEFGAGRQRPLHRRVDGVAPVGRVVVADRAARLHGGGGDAVDDELLFDDSVGAREGGVGGGLVADQLDEADIVRAVVPHARRAWARRLGGGGDRRQRFEIDLDHFGGVHRLRYGLGHHEGHAFAEPAHAILRQDRIARLVHGRAVAALEAAGNRQVADSRRP